MASNSFGIVLKITTWGESHGPAVGVVIDGCPSGIPLDEEEVRQALRRRAPGKTRQTSQRNEDEHAQILSGVFEGVTTGAPIAILIPNTDVDSSTYEPIKELLRPGHANFTYLQKYGIFDYRGGGRASARETACRVAAGVVAQKILAAHHIHLVAYLKQVGGIVATIDDMAALQKKVDASPFFCPDPTAAAAMAELIDRVKAEEDSIGGLVEFCATDLPPGLGDPVYEKLDSRLAYALLSIPGSMGFEIGSGFQSVVMKGSEHNDPFMNSEGRIMTSSNHAGGVLGGISTGMPLIGRVAFKPTSSIMKPMPTVTTTGEPAVFHVPPQARHDPCIAIRAVPVVEAMVALVLADALLTNRSAKL